LQNELLVVITILQASVYSTTVASLQGQQTGEEQLSPKFLAVRKLPENFLVRILSSKNAKC